VSSIDGDDAARRMSDVLRLPGGAQQVADAGEDAASQSRLIDVLLRNPDQSGRGSRSVAIMAAMPA
jgi:hypothetical protein